MDVFRNVILDIVVKNVNIVVKLVITIGHILK